MENLICIFWNVALRLKALHIADNSLQMILIFFAQVVNMLRNDIFPWSVDHVSAIYWIDVIDSRYDCESFDPRAADIYALGMVLCELSLTKLDEGFFSGISHDQQTKTRRKQEGWRTELSFTPHVRERYRRLRWGG